MRKMRAGLTRSLLIIGILIPSSPALADHLVVKRHVTLRSQPNRASAAIEYPEPGTELALLDDGRRTRGYYHAERADGRRGWIYQTFVERRQGDPAGTVANLTPAPVMSVHYVDVDQGAAAVLEFPCAVVMVDAGGRTDADRLHLLDYLHRIFARRPELGGRISSIFITHTHIDHNRNLRAVVEAFPVGGYVDNGFETGSGSPGAKWIRSWLGAAGATTPHDFVRDAQVEAAGAGGLTDDVVDPVSCVGVDPRISVLAGGREQNPGWPDGEFENGNNQSLVIRVDFGKASFLFTGDMEDTALETLVDRWTGTPMLDVDVWTVGHHGSHNGTTAPLLAVMTPKVAVISMGRETVQQQWTAWAYGHPRRDVVEAVAASVVQGRAPVTVRVADKVRRFSDYRMTKAVYATGWDGDVTVTADTNGKVEVLAGQ